MTPRRQRTEISGVGLSWLELGPVDGEPLVMLHGMRDVAWSLLPVAEALSGRFRVVLPELRGHGDSARPGAYTIDHFLYDLHRLTGHLDIGPAVLFGHSLGGQIVARYGAAFPDRVRAAVLVEGLGPPARPGEDDPARQIRDHGQRLLTVLDTPARQRPLPGLEFAAERLLANNPRLDPARARELAERATRRSAAGELEWAFDPRVPSVFLSVRRDDTERYWRELRCPTLIVSGDLAAEYWRAQMPIEWDGAFAPGELEARVARFPDAEHVAIADAGHMVHFDQCETLTRAVADFLERRL
ncbi:MAG: alpha/beta hydrolase [Pseudomonadales bacterium]